MLVGAVQTGSDSLTVFIFVVGILLAVIGSLTGLIVGFIYRKLNENARHVVSLLYELRFMEIRMTSAEQHLQRRDNYEPPRLTAEHERI